MHEFQGRDPNSRPTWGGTPQAGDRERCLTGVGRTQDIAGGRGFKWLGQRAAA